MSGMDKNRFVPEDKGRLVTAFLDEFFGRYVEYDFTAELEDQLDEVSAGELDWKDLLREFWEDFAAGWPRSASELRTREVLDALDRGARAALFPERRTVATRGSARAAATGRLA